MTPTNWLTSNNKLSIFIILLLAKSVFAQNSFADYKRLYPDYNEIIISDVLHYDFSIQDKKLKVIQDNHYESMILNENGIQNNQESFTYSELVKLLNYEAYTVVNINGRDKKIKVTQTNENPYHSSNIFHNDVKERQLIFPNIDVGVKKVFDYQVELKDPFLLHKFVFQKSVIPCLEASLEIKADKDIDVGYKVFNDPNNLIVFTKTEKKGKIFYSWTLKNAKPIRFEENSPGYLHELPHIDVYIKNYKVDDKEVRVLSEVSDLYKYYSNFVKDLNKTEHPELKELSIQLTQNQSDEINKVKSILYWVKDNIQYIAFENGYEGFIPREASVVFERKFGDCKDMANLISTMAKYAQIKNVSIAWIGTREIPYSYQELATPSVDNHMIAVYQNNGQYYFLDATDKNSRFGIPTEFIQGKQALIYQNDQYTIVDVPVTNAQDNGALDQAYLKIIDDKLIGTGKLTLKGYNRSSIISLLSDETGDQRLNFMKDLLLKGNNKFKLIKYSEENLTDRDQPYIIHSEYEIDNYIVRVEKDIFLGLCLDKRFVELMLDSDRTWKYDLHFIANSVSIYTLDIPKGYQVKYLPQNFTIDNDVFYVNTIYTVKDEKIKVEIQIHSKKIVIEPSDFEIWNNSIKKMKREFGESLILTQK